MAITVREDYKGFHKIFQSNKDALEEYIARYERHYLIKLLGCELYDLFIADLDGANPDKPQTQRFIDIFDPFCEDEGVIRGNYVKVRGYGIFPDDDCFSDCPYRYESKGIDDMLKGFIRFHFLRDQGTKVTEVGYSAHNSDTFTGLQDATLTDRLSTVWGESADTFNAISYRICDRLSDYSEYQGDYHIGKITNLGL